MNYLITGASGFIGKSLLNQLLNGNHRLTVLVRKRIPSLSSAIKQVVFDPNGLKSIDDSVLKSIDSVIHLAGRAHQVKDSSARSLEDFRVVNRDLTILLATLSISHGVKRFIYLSSIKVNGEYTAPGNFFTPDDFFSTNDPYGISKYEAESGLLNVASQSEMDAVIIRPPLVYGPNAKGNFKLLINWVRKGIPLPLGMIDNKRSLIALDNLIDFILLCSDRAKSPKAANQIFLLSDGEDVSTTTLLRKVAEAYGTKSRLLPVPVFFMRLAANLIGKSDFADRLFDNLQVDSSKARDLLGWSPVVTMDEQLRKMAEFDGVAGKL